jgi:plasmid maintenance system killer protein
MERKVRFEPETDEQWLVKHLLGDLDRAVNSEMMKLALKLGRSARYLRLQGNESIDVMRVRSADRMLQVCSLHERRAEVNELNEINQTLKTKLELLKSQMPKAKQQLERGEIYLKRADDQVNCHKSKMNDQHQLCKQLENKLFELGFCVSITDPAIRKLEKQNEQLEKQLMEAQKYTKGLGLREFTETEVRKRIEQMRDELNAYDDLFDEQTDDIFPDL